MATDTEIAKGVAAGLVSSALAVNATATNPINPQQANGLAIAEVQKQRRQKIVIVKAAADAMASTATAEASQNVGTDFQGRVYACYFTPTGAGLTADASNYATVTLSARTAAGGASTSFATLTTTVASSGTLTQYVRKAMVLTTVDIAAGCDITLTIAKTGTGVVVPVGYFTILIEDT